MSPIHESEHLAVDRAAQELLIFVRQMYEEHSDPDWTAALDSAQLLPALKVLKFQPPPLTGASHLEASSRALAHVLYSSSRDEAIEIAREAVRTRHTAQALGDAIHAAQVSASPALAAAAQARENLYDAIAAEFGLLSSTEAGEAMGSRAAASRNVATKARREGRALALIRSNYTLFPGFQFDDAGLRPVIKHLIDVGNEHDRTETGLIQWMVSPTTYLHGERPVDVIDDPDKLLETARSAFGVQW